MTELPSYEDLPLAPDGGRSGWGVFGPDDNVGLFNLQTPEGVLNASALIRKGVIFPLDAPIDAYTPPLTASRGIPRHRILHERGASHFDDVYDNFYPQGSSQWDALAHFGYGNGLFYNGATEDEILAGQRNTIDHWARRGIVGRAVLFDMVRTLADAGRPYDPGTNTSFSVDDLELARARAGVELQPGDVLLVHTGFAAWYLGQDRAKRVTFTRNLATPGLGRGEEMCRYLWDSHVSAVASDTYGVESFPGGDARNLHTMLIGQFGMALGELWWTEDLARHCADDGIYEMFFSSMPLNAPGAIGSPPNAMAIK